MADYNRIARAKRVREAQEGIRAALDHEGRRVFSPQDLVNLFQKHREEWGILANITSKNFIEYLQRELKIRKLPLKGQRTPRSSSATFGVNPPQSRLQRPFERAPISVIRPPSSFMA